MTKKLLIFDDDKNVRELIRTYVTEMSLDFEVIEAGHYNEGLQHFQNTKIDVLLCDLKMPGKTGLAFLRTIHGYPHEKWPECIVVISELIEISTSFQSEMNIAQLKKPFTREELETYIHAALKWAEVDDIFDDLDKDLAALDRDIDSDNSESNDAPVVAEDWDKEILGDFKTELQNLLEKFDQSLIQFEKNLMDDVSLKFLCDHLFKIMGTASMLDFGDFANYFKAIYEVTLNCSQKKIPNLRKKTLVKIQECKEIMNLLAAESISQKEIQELLHRLRVATPSAARFADTIKRSH